MAFAVTLMSCLLHAGAVLGYDLTDVHNINTHLNGLMNLDPHSLKDQVSISFPFTLPQCMQIRDHLHRYLKLKQIKSLVQIVLNILPCLKGNWIHK